MSKTVDQAFEQIMENLSAALDAWYSGNPFPYCDLFAEEITYFDPMTPERIETREALIAHGARFEGQFVFPRHEIIEPVCQAVDEQRVLTYFLRQYSADGPYGPTWKSSELYKNIDGQWRIVHAHWSAIAPEE